MNKYKKNELPDNLGFNWTNYSWNSKTDYAVIFNFNGVLLASREINKNAWGWVFEQLRIDDADNQLSILMNSGLLPREILLYMLGKYYKAGLNLSLAGELTRSWATVKEQYLADIFSEGGQPLHGAEELLQELTSKRIKVGLYSMFSLRFVLEILHRTKLKQFFSAVVTPELIRSDFRDRETFIGCLSEVIARLDMDKEQKAKTTEQNNCFLLEDSIGCVGMATEHGVICIGVGMENRSELKKTGAICVVDDHNDLLDIFINSQNKKEVVKKLEELDEKIQKNSGEDTISNL